jgi:fibronectin-binding autotransporter adhesin
MSPISRSRLLATSAIASLSILHLAVPALGADRGLQLPEGEAAPIDNSVGQTIEGDRIGIFSRADATVITNAGTIRGNGSADGLDVLPEGGITIDGGPATITNSGTISGAGVGITTAYFLIEETGVLEGRAIDLSIVNSGTIAGERNDGIRLIGGGSVVNSGTISGTGAAGADGISIYAYDDQNVSTIASIGTVTNAAAGTITGNRFGVVLFDGGVVDNQGVMTGNNTALWIQGNNPQGTGKTASVTNGGTISGSNGLIFANLLASSVLVNSGTISGTVGYGVANGSAGRASITNEAGATITGATIGIFDEEGGIDLVNAGIIRGNGSADGLDVLPEAGVTLAGAPSTINNSGTISGAGAGITTAYYLNSEADKLEGRATGIQIINSGTIAGESNDGIRLIGGGSVTNSGTVSGSGAAGADGISIYGYDDQASGDYNAFVGNAEDGTIAGVRFGIIMSGGGNVENAGGISGVEGGIFVQGTSIGGVERSGQTASVVNSGVISGSRADGNDGFGVGFGSDLATATLDNSGTISSAAGAGVYHGMLGAVTVENDASGVIDGGAYGIYADGEGSLAIINAGTIQSAGTGIESLSQTSLDNSGTIIGEGGVAIRLGAFDDSVTLRRGSAINGSIDAGGGVDRLTLDGDILDLTAAQQLGAATGFEMLEVAAGYWTTTGIVGTFDNVTIASGGALQVNEADLGGGAGLSSPILTPAVTTNGRLVLNFSENDLLSELDQLSITGTGSIELIGEAVFTVDTDMVAHSGGTTIANGGLLLTGTLHGDVTTRGDGVFQLGAGGTEGIFAGDLVNDGRFIFNRSDDYDFLGAFSGSGILDKRGDGTLVFAGDYSFTGITNILAGSVRIGGLIDPKTEFSLGSGSLDIAGNDQTIGGLSGGTGANVELGDNVLTVDQGENSEFAGTISGTGGFTKSGDGRLNLTGTSDYSGPTTVNGGTLAVNGSIASSPVSVGGGGTLGGNGTVGSTVVGGGGTIAPGNSIGRLTVAGDLAFAAGSIYEVEVNAAGDSDRLDATGIVTIASSASVSVLAAAGDYKPRTDYIILTGAGGVTGTFGSVTTDLAFLDPLLRYGPDAVRLSLYRNDIVFADVAVGSNQAGVAASIQARGIDDPLFEALLVQNAAGAQAAYGDLSGEILADTVGGLTDDSRHLRNAIMGMTAPRESGAFIWGSAFGGWGNFDAPVGGRGVDTDHKGLVAGFGYGTGGFAAALSAGIGKSDFRLDGTGDRAKVDSKYLAAHLSYGAGDGLSGSAGIAYGWHDVDTTRSVTLAPLAQTLTSNRDADTFQLFGELGYDLAMGKAVVSPFARLAHVRTKSEGFVEAGGDAALVIADMKQEASFLSLGARARFNSGEAGFQPYVSAAWNRAYGDRAAVNRSSFASGGGTSFTIAGAPISRNSAEVEAGFDYSTGAFRIGAAYTGTLSSDRSTHGARVTATISF